MCGRRLKLGVKMAWYELSIKETFWEHKDRWPAQFLPLFEFLALMRLAAQLERRHRRQTHTVGRYRPIYVADEKVATFEVAVYDHPDIVLAHRIS